MSEKARVESIVNQIEGGPINLVSGRGRRRGTGVTLFRVLFRQHGSASRSICRQLGPRANSLRQFRFPLISRVTTGGPLSPPSPNLEIVSNRDPGSSCDDPPMEIPIFALSVRIRKSFPSVYLVNTLLVSSTVSPDSKAEKTDAL